LVVRCGDHGNNDPHSLGRTIVGAAHHVSGDLERGSGLAHRPARAGGENRKRAQDEQLFPLPLDQFQRQFRFLAWIEMDGLTGIPAQCFRIRVL
jgi:hypothetical protein